jgi:hypothetical protein
MAFAWPDGVQNKTKRLISQVLWTLHLDFDGAIRGSRDAPMELMEAMQAHGVEIKNPMTFRMMLPYMDGGKYGKLITRVVIQRRTPEIRLAVRTLPEESCLPDGAGGIAVDDQIDMQLFGDAAWTPARGATRDTIPAVQNPARETRDIIESKIEPARRDARDIVERSNPARGDARDEVESSDLVREDARDSDSSNLAREETRDSRSAALARETRNDGLPFSAAPRDGAPVLQPARELALDDRPSWHDEVDDLGLAIRRLDGELAELEAPLPVDEDELSPHDILSLVAGLMSGLMADLDGLVKRGPLEASSSGHSEEDYAALLAEKYNLAEQLGRLMRRVKDAEARLIERNKEVEGARLQLAALNTRYERLEANNRALLEAERPGGQHLRAAERFISETPSDRPERGRSRPTRPNGRTTGSDSKLAYSIG